MYEDIVIELYTSVHKNTCITKKKDHKKSMKMSLTLVKLFFRHAPASIFFSSLRYITIMCIYSLVLVLVDPCTKNTSHDEKKTKNQH